MSDKRRWCRSEPRGLVPVTGKISLGKSEDLIECRVVDLSVGGACLEFAKQHVFPDRFEFIHGRTRRSCRLAWKRGVRIGITYDASSQRSMISGGVSQTKSGLSRLSRSER